MLIKSNRKISIDKSKKYNRKKKVITKSSLYVTFEITYNWKIKFTY